MGKKKYLIIMVSLILALVMPVASFGSEGTTDSYLKGAITLGEVKLKDKVTAQINDLMLAPSNSGQTMSLIMKVINDSDAQVNMIDFWLNIYTKSGTKLTVQTDSGSNVIIPANTTKEILFYSTVSSSIKASDLVIQVIKWDFAQSDYMRVLGQINVPQRYNPVTTANDARVLNTGATSVTFQIKRGTLGASEEHVRANLELVIRNDGTNTVVLPDYKIYLLTDENLLYPLNATQIKDTSLDPLVSKTFKLNTSIPKAASVDNLKIIVMYPVKEGTMLIPLGQFEFPEDDAGQSGDVNEYYSFTTMDGVYHIKINSFDKLPIEDNDLVIANVVLENKSEESLPIPKLNASYKFNDSIKKTATVTSNDKLIALQPNESMEIQISGLIPYTFDVHKIELNIQQATDDQSDGIELVNFTYAGKFRSIPVARAEVGFQVTDLGYRSKINLEKLMLFKGNTANIIATQVVVTNQERRLTDMKELAGYFEKADGTIYPAQIQSIDEKLSPGGRALIYVWAPVPLHERAEDLNLVLGKAIVETNNAGDKPNKLVTGYVSPYMFKLPTENEVKDGLQNLELAPLQFSIKSVKTTMDFQGNRVNLEFDYDLQQDVLTKGNLKGQQIVVEIKDDKQTNVLSKSLTLDEIQSQEPSETALKLGKNKMKLSWVDESFLVNVSTLKDFELNVYHEFQPGYKKLIATQKIPWLVNRTLAN